MPPKNLTVLAKIG